MGGREGDGGPFMGGREGGGGLALLGLSTLLPPLSGALLVVGLVEGGVSSDCLVSGGLGCEGGGWGWSEWCEEGGCGGGGCERCGCGSDEGGGSGWGGCEEGGCEG